MLPTPTVLPVLRPLPQRWLEAAMRRVVLHAGWYNRDPATVVNDLRRLDHLLFEHARWQVAHTMPHNPHCYTLRRRWTWPGGDEDFQWVVGVIRALGDHEKFPPAPHKGGKYYTVLHRRDSIFWTMGWPINYSNGHPCTLLINRKPIPPERTVP